MADTSSSETNLRMFWQLIGVGVLIRLIFMGVINLMPEEAAGRNVIVVSFNENDLKPSWVTHHFTSTSEIYEEDLRAGNRVVTRFYWRVGYDHEP